METLFRFQKLEIWQRGAAVGQALFDVAEELESSLKAFRWAEQLRSAALSITNNIAEGSGSYSKAEFAQFLNFARRSTFECANILLQLALVSPAERPWILCSPNLKKPAE